MSLLDQQWCPSSVQVTVLQARGLRIKGKSGTNDAYAVMQVGKEKFQTSVAEKSVAPVWKEEAAFDLPPLLHGAHGSERGTLHVHVLHRALVGPDKLLGQAVINLLQLSEDKTRSKTEWFKLLDKTGKPDKDRGEVLLDIQFMRNNMTASMFDLSAAGKSRSRLGKFKDKVRGKKKESDSGSNTLPSFTQVLTDSEEEANGGEVAASKDGKSKKHKMKSLFSPKSNLQKNMSQSMSVLPGKNSTLSGSQSSGLNVDSSEGKKKFKFKIHKRSGSTDSKDSSSGLQKQLPVEQSNLCINGSHIYCEEPPTRSSRIGSNFSLASSGHGSMEEVPENSPPSVDSLRAVRQYSPWTEEEEEEMENIKEDESRREEEEKVRRQQEELERLAEEEERRRVEEQKVKREEAERIRREEEECERLAEEQERRKIKEEEEKRQREEEERIRMEEERAQEERRRRQEEEERVRREEEHKLAEEKRRVEEEERRRIEEGKRRREEERAEEERRQREEEERVRKEKEEHERLMEEKRKVEDEKKRIEAEERRKMMEEERMRKEEQERKQREEEERVRKEKEEYERLMEEKRKVEDEKKRTEERRKMEEERMRKEEQERKQREEEERVRKEKEEYERLMEEKRKLEEEKERIEAEEKLRKEEEERIRMEKERMRKQEEEKRRLEEQERMQREEEERIKKEELRQQEEEERVRKENEEYERLMEEKRKEEDEKKRMEAEEKLRKEEEERARMEEEMRRQEEEERVRKEKEEYERLMEEKRKLEEKERIKAEEKLRKEEEEERIRMEEERRRKEEEEKRRREEQERIRAEEEKTQREEEERRREEEERARKEKEEYERLEEERMKEEEQRRRTEEEERIRKEEQEKIKMEEKRRQEEEERTRKVKEEMERLAEERRRKEEKEKRRIEEEEKVRREEEERIRRERKEKEEARRLEKEKLKRDAEEQKKMENKDGQKAAGKKSKLNSSADVCSTNPFDENYSYNPFEEIPDSPPGAKEANVQQRCQSAVSSLGSKIVSTDEKELVGAQREKRPAPQPPGRNQAEKPSEQDASGRHLGQINTQNKDKEVKMVSVSPQRSVQMIVPVSRSPADSKNDQSGTAKGTTGKHGKRHAPPRPRSVDEEPKTTSTAETKPTVCGLNPFEDDEDENDAGPVCWPPAADKDAASQIKTKSSKVARAPPPPQHNGTLITQNAEGDCVAEDTVPDGVTNEARDPQPEAVNPTQVQESPVQNTVEAHVKKEGPPVAARRLQPVKPLNSVEQQSVSVVQGENKSTGIHGEAQDKAKVNDAGLKGPFSQLTQEELISLVLKQENQLSERDRKISELEQYIDNLLVRVIEVQPSILMSMNSLKKAA